MAFIHPRHSIEPHVFFGKTFIDLNLKPEPPFDPASLFKNGEQGIWLDPNDLSTMFQDAAGTVPVAEIGQPVGLILDKSQGINKRRNMLPDSSLSTGLSALSARGGDIQIVNQAGKHYIRIDNSGKTADAYAYMRPMLPIGTSVTFSVSLKREDGSAVTSEELISKDCRIVADGNGVPLEKLSIVELEGGGVRVSTKYTITKSSSSCGIVKYISSSASTTLAWDYQVDIGDMPTEYQATVGNYDWEGKRGAVQPDSAKRPTLVADGVWKGDGVDDFMYLASVLQMTEYTVVSRTYVPKASAKNNILVATGVGSYPYRSKDKVVIQGTDLGREAVINELDTVALTYANGITRIRTSVDDKSYAVPTSWLSGSIPIHVGIFSPTGSSKSSAEYGGMLIINRQLNDSEVSNLFKFMESKWPTI